MTFYGCKGLKSLLAMNTPRKSFYEFLRKIWKTVVLVYIALFILSHI